MDNYLQHHGVKGMKWGVRKQYVHTGFGVRRKVKTNSKSMSEEEAKKARRRQIAKRVAIGLGVTAGIAGTAYAVKRIGGLKLYPDYKTLGDAVRNAPKKPLDTGKSDLGKSSGKNLANDVIKRSEKVAGLETKRARQIRKDLAKKYYPDYKTLGDAVRNAPKTPRVAGKPSEPSKVIQKTLAKETPISKVKAETFKPKTFKPKTFKPESFKPESFKPESFSVDDFTQELLRKNASRLASLGY